LSQIMTISLEPAVPILRIFEEKLARDFYLGWLGFALDWEHRFEPGTPLYAQVSRDALKLHLSEHVGDGTPGTMVYLPMSGIRAYHAELHARPWKLYRPGLGPGAGGGLCMDILDPFGNGLRFAERA
jgi:hypothetical protein